MLWRCEVCFTEFTELDFVTHLSEAFFAEIEANYP
jgi:hypothetical protein